MDYQGEIVRILSEAGADGLSVKKISRHVYNASNTFFETIDFEEVHRFVSNWLFRKSRQSSPIVEKTSRGVYRLLPHSAVLTQLKFAFDNETTADNEKPVQQDLSLCMFDDDEMG